VYHSVFDDFDWFTRFADPDFAYTQQQARLLGIELLHMADADVLPYDDQMYADEILRYLAHTKKAAIRRRVDLDFSGAEAAAQSFATTAQRVHELELAAAANTVKLNGALRAAESALLLPQGLPRRPWYRHSIFAPGEFTGYAAVALPGVSDAIEEQDAARAQAQLDALAQALRRAATALDAAR
jgi:N-acetylated-alpha-linked acidic dipeptidase